MIKRFMAFSFIAITSYLLSRFASRVKKRYYEMATAQFQETLDNLISDWSYLINDCRLRATLVCPEEMKKLDNLLAELSFAVEKVRTCKYVTFVLYLKGEIREEASYEFDELLEEVQNFDGYLKKRMVEVERQLALREIEDKK